MQELKLEALGSVPKDCWGLLAELVGTFCLTFLLKNKRFRRHRAGKALGNDSIRKKQLMYFNEVVQQRIGQLIDEAVFESLSSMPSMSTPFIIFSRSLSFLKR